MRKLIAWLCALVLLLGAAPALSEDAVAVEGPAGVQTGTRIIVGSPNAMSGYFALDMFGNNTADLDVRALLHGYETVAWTQTFGMEPNRMVLTGVQTQEQPDGSVEYLMQFNENLTYNDGTPITAKDYAFYYLLSGAPEIDAIGGTTQGLSHIIGYDEYQAGTAKTLAGVRLVSDHLLSLRVKGDTFPYFYGLALLIARPYPISAIAPGCEIVDNGEGVQISGDFSADLLRKTLLDTESGYLFNPTVTSGPYSFVSFDTAAGEATFRVNERFLGNYEGQKPHIEEVVFRHVDEANAMEMLASGELDVLNKMSDGASLFEKLDALWTDQSEVQVAQYLRTGFAFLAFACEDAPTDSAAVRRAIAMSLDKDALIQETMANFALRADGYYGLGQWMVTYTDDGEITGKEPMRTIDELNKLVLPTDLSAAEALLVEDGWTLNAAGEDYTAGEDEVRHKMIGETLTPLTIRWALAEGNPFVAELTNMLRTTLPALGIGLEITELSFPELLEHYYRREAREYNMFFLASNFSFIYDPYYDFNTADEYQGIVNTSGLRDDELMQLALEMRETESSDLRTYVDKWLAFQARFVEVMPMVPLYSNIYFDVYSDRLMNYNISANSGWSYAITYAYLSE